MRLRAQMFSAEDRQVAKAGGPRPRSFTGAVVIFYETQSNKVVPRINHSLGAATMLRARTPVLNDAPPIVFSLSDDECVQRLALLIEHRDNKNLDEIVVLIARLAVPIDG